MYEKTIRFWSCDLIVLYLEISYYFVKIKMADKV